jgi:hypothetical protein
MANYIEKTTLSTRRFVTITSRYYNSEVIYYTDKKFLTFNTYKKNKYPQSQQDRFMVIEKGYEYRPDLVSEQAYNLPDFWWKILEANDMKDIYEFKSGTNIRIPAISL